MRYVISEEKWRADCIAVGQHPSSVPHTLTDLLIDKILRAHVKERLEFPDRSGVNGLYLRAGVDRQQGDDVVPGSRPWMLRWKMPNKGKRLNYKIGDARRGMTLAQARQRASVDLAKIGVGEDPLLASRQESAQRQTVGHFLETVYRPQKLAHCKTGDEIERNIRQVWAPILDKALCALTLGDVEATLTAHKATGVAGGSMEKAWGAFRALLRHADKTEAISADLARKLMRKPDAMHRMKGAECKRYLGERGEDEVRRFAAALAAFETHEPGGGSFLRTVVKLSLATGMRTGEILGLGDNAINLPKRTLLLKARTTKGNKDHVIDLPDSAVTAIIEWRKVRAGLTVDIKSPPGALFPVLSGYPADHWKWRLTAHGRDFHKMRKAAHINDRCECCSRVFHPHLLRHTFAVRFLRSGGTMAELQKALGHSSIVTTESHYGRILEEDVRKVVMGMPDVLAV